MVTWNGEWSREVRVSVNLSECMHTHAQWWHKEPSPVALDDDDVARMCVCIMRVLSSYFRVVIVIG